MAENKNNRKSNRNFRLDKHVERHFEIEKGTDDASVMPDNTLTEPPSTPPEVGPAPISLSHRQEMTKKAKVEVHLSNG